jgi:hypothetical protein
VAKRRQRKRRPRRFIFWLALVLLIAGFVVRRTLPLMLERLRYRPVEPSHLATQHRLAPEVPETGSVSDAHNPSNQNAQPQAGKPAPRENLSESDRQELNEVLRRKGR